MPQLLELFSLPKAEGDFLYMSSISIDTDKNSNYPIILTNYHGNSKKNAPQHTLPGSI